jgi:hypothetical protein
MKDEHHETQPEGQAGDAGDAEGATHSRGPRRRFSPRTAVIAVVAMAMLAVGGGAAYATGSGQDGPSTKTKCPPVAAPGEVVAPGKVVVDGRRPDGRIGFARPLHGEFVVATKNGTETHLMQAGKVTARTDDSITVVSSDDYTKQYKVEKSTLIGDGKKSLSDLATGDMVTVLAKKSGDTAIAILIDGKDTILLPPPDGARGPLPLPGPAWDACVVPRAS